MWCCGQWDSQRCYVQLRSGLKVVAVKAPGFGDNRKANMQARMRARAAAAGGRWRLVC